MFIQKPLLHFHSVAKNLRKPSKWYKTSFSITLQRSSATTGFSLCLSSNTYYSSALIIHLLILLLMIRHRFPVNFPKWTSLLSLLLVRATPNWKGLSCQPSKSRLQPRGKKLWLLETRDKSTVSRLSFRPDSGSYLTRKAVLCSKCVYFIYIHLPALFSCSTHTKWYN